MNKIPGLDFDLSLDEISAWLRNLVPGATAAQKIAWLQEDLRKGSGATPYDRDVIANAIKQLRGEDYSYPIPVEQGRSYVIHVRGK